MSRIAYFRVSSTDQSIEAQRRAMGGTFDEEFSDEGVSGGIAAADRPGFSRLLAYIRKGDTLCVYAVDRLGRDALDVQSTVRRLLDRGITVDVHGLGSIGRGVGELILAVLAQVAEMEKRRIVERCEAGREAAKASLAATGRTHRGKTSLGRPPGRGKNGVVVKPHEVTAWRAAHAASIAATAEHFGVSTATVKRYVRAAA